MANGNKIKVNSKSRSKCRGVGAKIVGPWPAKRIEQETIKRTKAPPCLSKLIFCTKSFLCHNETVEKLSAIILFKTFIGFSIKLCSNFNVEQVPFFFC